MAFFRDLLKKWFYTNSSSAASSDARIPLLTATGEPKGSDTMASIASVLGEQGCVVFNSLSDLMSWASSKSVKGIYYAKLTQGGVGEASLGNVYVLTCYDENTKTLIRTCAYSSDINSIPLINNSHNGNWLGWQTFSLGVPSFYKDYGSLSALASALGVTKRMEFVDLGLPSGTLWATRNLGAETPEDYGYYFSWGNVIGRKPNGTTFDYDWGTDNNGNYASTPGAALTGDIPTNMDYDAVQRYMGGSCKMPTKDQFVELFNSSYTTNEWTTKNGVNGRLVTSKINSNSIFFPAAGYGHGASLYNAGSNGNYWSRSLNSSDNGYNLNFNSSGVNPQNNDGRFFGFSVRAVQ